MKARLVFSVSPRLLHFLNIQYIKIQLGSEAEKTQTKGIE